MADLTIELVIPEAKIQTAKTGYFKLYPNVEKNEDGSAKYNDLQWFKECERRRLVRDIRRGLQMIANEGVVVGIDDTIVG